jgi:glycosyltransferase involved in cell wall biosynthesis
VTNAVQPAREALSEYCSTSSRRPVVVIATDRCSPARGGVQTYVQQLIDCLSDRFRFVILCATRDTAGVEDAVLRPGPAIINRMSTGRSTALVVCVRLGPASAATFRGQCEAERRLNAAHPETYYTNRWKTMSLLAALAADEFGQIPVSDVIVHGMGPWEMSLVAERLFPESFRVVTPFIHPGNWGDDAESIKWLATADRLVALTSADQAVCAAAGLPIDRIALVPVPYARRSSAPTSGPRDMVLFVGVNRPYKGADLFVRAAELIAHRWPSIDFVLLTSPPQGGDRQGDLPTSERVRYVSSVSDRERDEFLSRAVCVVLPSATEISPYAVLEGWDHGAAAIVSDDAHFRSFVGGGAVCVPRTVEHLAEAMSGALSETTGTIRMAELGRRRLDELHAPESVASMMAKVYSGGARV